MGIKRKYAYESGEPLPIRAEPMKVLPMPCQESPNPQPSPSKPSQPSQPSQPSITSETTLLLAAAIGLFLLSR